VFESDSIVVRLAVALGVGLLIGLERERRKGTGPRRAAAGVRTFALTALAGALALEIGGELTLVAAAVFLALLTALAYRRTANADPGLTTEMALLATLLLGAFAMRDPAVAAGAGIVVAILLASRDRLHRFVRGALSDQEVHDALLFAAAALIVLPLTPDRAVGPYGAFNPRTIWRLVVLILGIQGAGHVAVRVLGARWGLPLSGFASGFVSSSATIGAFGARAGRQPALTGAAVSGAVLSTVATVVQMVLILGAASPALLRATAWPLGLAGLVAVAYGLAFALRGASRSADTPGKPGRAFELRTALVFAATIGVVLGVSAVLTHYLGRSGLILATALAGFADAHSAGISVASLANVGRIQPDGGVLPILAGLTTNTITKVVVAVNSGCPRFAWQVIPGLIAVIAAAWAGLAIASVHR